LRFHLRHARRLSQVSLAVSRSSLFPHGARHDLFSFPCLCLPSLSELGLLLRIPLAFLQGSLTLQRVRQSIPFSIPVGVPQDSFRPADSRSLTRSVTRSFVPSPCWRGENYKDFSTFVNNISEVFLKKFPIFPAIYSNLLCYAL
jgi:hypothetical protein